MAVVSGIYGAIYETLFYLLNNNALCKRGSCFGPWIEIYGIGCLLIYFLCHRYKRSPLKVFLIAGLSCGLLEYLAGKGMYLIFDGRRGWNYNTEILNFGNIEGFVCLRSVLVFAFSGLMLIYVIYPLLLFISSKVSKKIFNIVCITLAFLFLMDVVYNDIIVSMKIVARNPTDLSVGGLLLFILILYILLNGFFRHITNCTNIIRCRP